MRCIPLNTNKYMSFSIPIKKEVKESNSKKNRVITYTLKFMDTARHNNRALSTFVDNLSELNVCDCKENSDKNIIIKIKYEQGKTYIFTICRTCSRFRRDQPLNNLKHKFPSTYKLSNNDINKFVLLLKKGIYPYQYMDSHDKFNETTLPPIQKFYSNIRSKNINNDEYKHAKKVWDHFELKTLGDYHDLYVQADTAQLSDVF